MNLGLGVNIFNPFHSNIQELTVSIYMYVKESGYGRTMVLLNSIFVICYVHCTSRTLNQSAYISYVIYSYKSNSITLSTLAVKHNLYTPTLFLSVSHIGGTMPVCLYVYPSTCLSLLNYFRFHIYWLILISIPTRVNTCCPSVIF